MTAKVEVLKDIRSKCLDCSAYQPSEVRLCPMDDCKLWKYRFGTDPAPAKRGFAKKPSSSRSVLTEKSQLEPDGRPKKENPMEAATSDESID